VFSLFAHLTCTKCGAQYERDSRQDLCAVRGCAGSLFARYHPRPLDRNASRDRPWSMWRWHEMMPVEDPANVVTLGEGDTPLLRAQRLGSPHGFADLWIKDEGNNPTGSFKARGLSAAVSKAKELGYAKIALPTAGNAGGAAAAYAAKAGMECHVFMPEDTPRVFSIECERYGARVTRVPGLIDACGRIVAERAPREGWHDVSTLKEPYRVEGKKTMSDEMEQLGWIGGARPRMISVQASGCAPIAKAFAEGKAVSEKWENAQTYASGLRVPKAYADYLILRDIRASGGDAVAVTDEEMRVASDEIGSAEGLFVCPEGAAVWAAAKNLAAAGKLDPRSKIVLFNTGTGFKYIP
jgi:threonine synthase